MFTTAGDFERVAEALDACAPRFSADERRLARALYRELSAGDPVPVERLAVRLGLSAVRIAELLKGKHLGSLVYHDKEDAVIGFGGLAIVPMHHELRVNGRKLYAWCAWDSLFLPRVLDATARVESPCPETGERVRLTVSPERVEVEAGTEPVISFVLPEPETFEGDTSGTLASFCHHVFFFANPAAGADWTSSHPGTFLLTIDQAFQLGRRLTDRRGLSVEKGGEWG